jgi:hypothetical protein
MATRIAKLRVDRMGLSSTRAAGGCPARRGSLRVNCCSAAKNVLQASGMAENVLIPTRDSMHYQNGFHLLYYRKHENDS